MRLFAICISSLVRCLLRSLAHVLIKSSVSSLLSVKNSYTSDSGPLSRGSLQILPLSLWLIFSVSWHCLFLSRNLILMKSSLLIFSFWDHDFGVISKKSSPYTWPSRFSPMLSSRSFIVFHFTFRSAVHEFINFVKRIRCLDLFFCLWMSSLNKDFFKSFGKLFSLVQLSCGKLYIMIYEIHLS